MLTIIANCLLQRGPNTGTWAACGPRTLSVYRILHKVMLRKYIVLTTQPLLCFCFDEEGSLRMCCCTDHLALHTALASHTSL